MKKILFLIITLLCFHIGYGQGDNCDLDDIIGDLGDKNFSDAIKNNPELVDSWKKLDDLGDDIPDAIRKDPDVLEKISDFDADTGGRFDELGDEFKNIPDQHKKGWVDHLEQRTVDGKVRKAGGNADNFNDFQTDADVPSRYTEDNRFNDLASDPDQGGAIKPGTRREATAGLESESQGLLKGPIERGPKGIEFYDSNGSPWDVKTPPGNFFAVTNAKKNGIGDAIVNELTKSKIIDGVQYPAGKFINGKTGALEFKKVILDTSYINADQLQTLRTWLRDSSGLSADELSRIVEVNVNLK